MRGFIKDSNFDESRTSDSDRRILNNLAGEGIVFDISLFSNNLRNTSSITKDDYVIENNKFKITNQFKVPFSNNTVVKYNGVEYVVKNSNLVDSFQLFDVNSPTPFVPSAPFFDVIRDDHVLFENIQNLNPQRLQTKASGNDDVSSGARLFDPYTFLAINETIDSIVQSNDVYEYKRARSITTDKDTSVATPLAIDGTITITNLDSNGNPVGGVIDSESGPGMFINNGENNIRAFSDSTQPWSQIAGGLSTSSATTNVKTLIMTNPAIEGIQVTELSSQETIIVSQNDTYSIPVEIDGEIYYLLCKKITWLKIYKFRPW